MRYVLTIVAVALVAVMSVALIAPYLIDWSTQRGEIEARLSAITGADVSLTGPIELRVLPTPYLALGEGLVSAPGPDGAKLSFASARLELALVKLASGQIRFSDIRLEKPVLILTRGPDGALRLPPVQMAGLHSTGFDRLSVRDGRAKIVTRPSRTLRRSNPVEWRPAIRTGGSRSAPSGPRVRIKTGFSRRMSENRICPLASLTSANSSRAEANDSFAPSGPGALTSPSPKAR